MISYDFCEQFCFSGVDNYKNPAVAPCPHLAVHAIENIWTMRMFTKKERKQKTACADHNQ